MATAGTHPTPTKHPRAREERERARKSAAEHLQQASAEIDKARQEATADVRRSLDSALDIRVIRLGARWAAAPRTPEALKGLSDEIRKQKTKLGPPAPKGDGAKS